MTRTAALLLAAVTLFSYLGASSWLGELATHFRPQMTAAAAAVLLAAVFGRSWIGGIASVGALAANALPLAAYMTAISPAAPADGIPLRVLAVNLYYHHADTAAVRRLVEAQSPDIVFLTELTADHARLLEELRRVLPQIVPEPRTAVPESALLTRWRIDAVELDRSAPHRRPVIRAVLCNEICVTAVGLHPPTPLWPGQTVARDLQLGVAARWASASGGSTVVLGDLNCTPWSPAFDAFLAEGGLADSARGRPLVATWLSRFPLFGLPIDHVLVGKRIGVADRRIGPDVGSDHLPVIADLVVAR